MLASILGCAARTIYFLSLAYHVGSFHKSYKADGCRTSTKMGGPGTEWQLTVARLPKTVRPYRLLHIYFRLMTFYKQWPFHLYTVHSTAVENSIPARNAALHATFPRLGRNPVSANFIHGDTVDNFVTW